MTAEEFDLLTDRLCGKVEYLFFHLMGEPTLHPSLPKFVKLAYSWVRLASSCKTFSPFKWLVWNKSRGLEETDSIWL